MDEGHTRSAWPPHLYDNIHFIQERYEYVEMLRQKVGPTRLPPVLHHKAMFPYESEARGQEGGSPGE